jgi:hypothetical protein
LAERRDADRHDVAILRRDWNADSIVNLRMKAAVSGYAIARFDVYFGLNGAGLAKRAASMAAFERTSASSIMFCPLVQVTRM